MMDKLKKYKRGGRYVHGGVHPNDPKKPTIEELRAAIASAGSGANNIENSSTSTGYGGTSLDVNMSEEEARLMRLLEDQIKTTPEDTPSSRGSSTRILPEPTPTGGSTRVIKKSFEEEKKPQPTETEFNDNSKSSLEVNPRFGGNVQSMGFRGKGTSGGLKGTTESYTNDDGTLDTRHSSVSDLPEYISQDPYFKELLEAANKKYFEQERATGRSEGSPEADMIAKIMSGEILFENAKRDSGWQPRIKAAF